MERLIAIFQDLPVPEIAGVLRQAALGGLFVGAIGLLVGSLIGHVFIGLGIAVGIAIGIFNVRMIVKSVLKVTEISPEHPKRVLATKAVYRLGISTLIIIGLVVARFNLGAGAAGGIALFYLILMAVLFRSFLKITARMS
ncbi:MAG: hypothetical protein M1374_02490 [Firmicutes bacterium]|jgi:hypothetical protein|nr:hypothetical protein [Bacillota bacterium]